MSNAGGTGALAGERYRTAHEKGRALAELCRLQISRVPCSIVIVTAVAAGVPPMVLAGGVVLVCAATSVAAALNDLADVESDRVNARFDRPLVSGALGTRDLAWVVGVGASLVLISQLALAQPTGLLVTLGAATIAWGSACRPLELQRRGMAGLLALAVGYLVLPIVLIVGFGELPVVLPLALTGAGVLAHKDVRDLVGDRTAGKRTVLVRHGYRRTAVAAVVLAVAGTTGCALTMGVGWWTVPALATVAALGWMARRGHTSTVWTVSRIALVGTALGIGVEVARAGS